MGFLRRRHAKSPPGAGHDALGVSGVRFVDEDDGAARAELRRIVDEAVLLQGLAEDILDGVRARRSLSELARPGGALITRFVALREEVPEPHDTYLREQARTARETLDHHAVMLYTSLEMLGDLRPNRDPNQLDKLDGLGAPATRLCALQELLASAR